MVVEFPRGNRMVRLARTRAMPAAGSIGPRLPDGQMSAPGDSIGAIAGPAPADGRDPHTARRPCAGAACPEDVVCPEDGA